MTKSNRNINIVFGAVVGLLATVAAVSMYLNRDLAAIRDAPEPGFSSDPKLPENHPPLNASSQLAALEQMSKNNPGNVELKTQIGNAYYDMGQFQKAAAAYEESLKLRPQDPSVETDLGTCYHELGQDEKALTTLNKVLEYQPDFSQALYNKGIVLQSGRKDLKGAIAAWESLLKTNPNFPQRTDLEKKINQLKAESR